MSVYNLDPERFTPPESEPSGPVRIRVQYNDSDLIKTYQISREMLRQLTDQLSKGAGTYTLVDGDDFLYLSRYGILSIERI